MEIWLHVDIVAEALKRNEELALRGWYLLRTAQNGQGHCREPEFRAHLARLGYRRTAITGVMKRLLASGMATVATPKRGGPPVWRPLTAAEMVDRYGLLCNRRQVKMPLDELKGKALRQRLFAYVEAGLGDAPKARSTLEQLTGVPRTTQRRAEKRMGAAVTENYLRVSRGAIEAMPCVAEDRPGRKTFADDASLYFQTANSIAYPHIQRRKRVVHGSSKHRPRNGDGRKTRRRRLYFGEARAAVRQGCYWTRTDEGVITLPTRLEEPSRIVRGSKVRIWTV